VSYLFRRDDLIAITEKAIGLSHANMVHLVADELDRLYPGHVETRERWVFSLAGGATGIMTVLHGSLSEYVIIFGTPVGTEGFSGRYRLDIDDFVLAGEMWTYDETDVGARRVYRAGEWATLPRGRAKGFRLKEDTWLLEHGRGPVVTALPTALGDAITCLDLRTIGKTFWEYGRLVVRELRQGKI
jgi:C-8 sterol isomerase